VRELVQGQLRVSDYTKTLSPEVSVCLRMKKQGDFILLGSASSCGLVSCQETTSEDGEPQCVCNGEL
jgi:hypothetical protein